MDKHTELYIVNALLDNLLYEEENEEEDEDSYDELCDDDEDLSL